MYIPIETLTPSPFKRTVCSKILYMRVCLLWKVFEFQVPTVKLIIAQDNNCEISVDRVSISLTLLIFITNDLIIFWPAHFFGSNSSASLSYVSPRAQGQHFMYGFYTSRSKINEFNRTQNKGFCLHNIFVCVNCVK